jgi:LmbE family N-acetylglucosaminyl deacetylase
LIVISPHLDDAVSSCGALLAERDDVLVTTICAGIPPEKVPGHQFDQQAGFALAAEAMRFRRREHAVAARLLGFQARHMGCCEVNYDATAPIASAVDEALAEARPGELLIGPLGLRHPDHQAVASAFCKVVRARNLEAWLYEDLPYAITWPGYTDSALEAARCSSDVRQISADKEKKRRAVACYATQLTGMDVDALFGVERYHRLNGSAKL